MTESVQDRMKEIEAQVSRSEDTAMWAIGEIQAVDRAAKELSRQLKSMKRRLRRSTQRFCDLLDQVSS